MKNIYAVKIYYIIFIRYVHKINYSNKNLMYELINK